MVQRHIDGLAEQKRRKEKKKCLHSAIKLFQKCPLAVHGFRENIANGCGNSKEKVMEVTVGEIKIEMGCFIRTSTILPIAEVLPKGTAANQGIQIIKLAHPLFC
ncbi:hypothetical protein JXA02_10250 [candidate division KSB1 bacterium]|nr:hypothetical protein [candidate division KSB1 bacterium]